MRKIYYLFIIILLVPSLAVAMIVGYSRVFSLGAVARLDAPASGTDNTFSYPIGSGISRYLVVVVEEEGGLSTATVTYGGQSMSELAQVVADDGVETVTVFGIGEVGIHLASGTNVVVSSHQGYATFHALSYEGVSQSAPVAEIATDNTNAATPNPIQLSLTAGDNTMVLSAAGCGNATTASWNAAMTEQTDQQSGSSTGSVADKIVTSGGSVAAECTWTSQNRAAAVEIEFNHD